MYIYVCILVPLAPGRGAPKRGLANSAAQNGQKKKKRKKKEEEEEEEETKAKLEKKKRVGSFDPNS